MSLVPVTAARDSKESGVTKVTYRWQGAWTGWRVLSRPVAFYDTTFYSQLGASLHSLSVHIYPLVVPPQQGKNEAQASAGEGCQTRLD